jgi:hypothetical protein
MNTTNENERSELESLLPWHAAGTLSAREAQSVETALARDPELKRRYELVREELAQTIHLNETLGAPSARVMTDLFAKIDAEPKRHAAPSLNIGVRIVEFFGALSPRTLAWSAGAAALAIRAASGGDRRHRAQGAERRLPDGVGSGSGERRRQLCARPLQAAGDRCRHHTLSGNQQVERRWRPGCGRTLSRTDRRNQIAQGGTRSAYPIAAERRHHRLHRPDRMTKARSVS